MANQAAWRKSLIMRIPRRSKPKAPPEDEQLRIISRLLKLKHFQGIWYSKGTLSVRSAFSEPPRYLPWAEAVQMLELADALFPERSVGD